MKCETCNGRGLINDQTMCSVCAGSGSATLVEVKAELPHTKVYIDPKLVPLKNYEELNNRLGAFVTKPTDPLKELVKRIKNWLKSSPMSN